MDVSLLTDSLGAGESIIEREATKTPVETEATLFIPNHSQLIIFSYRVKHLCKWQEYLTNVCF